MPRREPVDTATTDSGASAGTWAPLALSTYRWLWIAQLVSNMGAWMQSVGAQWTMVHEPNAAGLTALVQAAALLPVLVVSFPAGVLADVLDRRRYLIGVFSAAVLVAASLAVVAAVGLVTPLALLLLTFALGVTSAMASPAWQAVQPELVPRSLIPAAAALASMNTNIARAVGPALAGVLLVVISPAALFAINAASMVAVIVALLWWRRPPQPDRTAEPLLSAARSGSRYLRHAPGVRRVLLRTGVFIVPASALWALLAVVANQRLRLGPDGYGMMLAALGTGAVLGALWLRPLRAALPRGALLAVFSSVYAAALVGAGVVRVTWVLVVLLAAAGMGWLVVLSIFSTMLQLTLPAWVRARGMAGYLVVLTGGQGIGSVLWGLVALRAGVGPALVGAGVLLGLGVLTQLWWPLRERTGSTDPSVDALWPEPRLAAEPDGQDGPVMVQGRYLVTDDVDAFVEAARRVGLSRRRTGATAWALYRDLADPSLFVEVFVLPTWDEHLRQHHERLTGLDRELDVRMRAHTTEVSSVRHLLFVTD